MHILSAEQTLAVQQDMQPANLILENGKIFSGLVPRGQEGQYDGEVVFSTGMTGYDASLTDPSYSGQILVFTYPIIGNYGIPDASTWESEKIHAAGVVICDLCQNWSHGKSQKSFLEWLQEQQVPLITQVDTRALTKLLRETGTVLGAITTNSSVDSINDPTKIVSVQEKIRYGVQGKKVIAVDCGMKTNILRCLQKFPIQIERVPYNYDYANDEFDGVFLSNGPGNPEMYRETIHILRKAMSKQKPIFGICLGAQLMGLAAGAKTYKLSYGHRGHNQPCMDLATQRCYITSQNHGYAVDESSLPDGWLVSFRNLNDGTVEGIRHRTSPFFAVQFHPEAAPGPTDTEWLFQRFYEIL